MEWIAYLVFALVLLALLFVFAYWISEKRKGHRILDDEPHLSGKDLVRLYKIQKRAEKKRKAKALKKEQKQN